MGIFRRTTDIIAANLNDLVDRFEQPEQMLRQALRDMETTLAATSAAVARSIATEKLLEKTQAGHEAHQALWHRRAADALADGDEALARQAIARQLHSAQALATTQRHLAEIRDVNQTLRAQLDTLRGRHANARVRLTTLAAQQSAAQAQREALATLRGPTDRGSAFSRFDRFSEQLELAQAEATALVELETGGNFELEAELARRTAEQAVDVELARLKAGQPATGGVSSRSCEST
jgi:phage shock protein A